MAITAGMPLYTIADLTLVWVARRRLPSEMASDRAREPGDGLGVLPSRRDASEVASTSFTPTLSEETRTIKVRLVLPNPKGLLKPGMFVRVLPVRQIAERRSPFPAPR